MSVTHVTSEILQTHTTSVYQQKDEKHKNVGNYELLQTIGEGSFAKVKLAIHKFTKQKVAIKIIEKDKLPDDYSLRNIHREAQIMRVLDHPNVVQLYEVMETKKALFLVLELASGGELLDYIISRVKIPEPEARRLFVQIFSALEHCHSSNIVHRDLKAENFLLDENMSVKLSDFGLSNQFDSSKVLGTCCGSPVYSAPELIASQKYVGPEVDAWSLGVNLYAMVVGELPFADNNLTKLYDSILKGQYHEPDFLSADLISKLLERNPKKRYTVAQAQQHPWMSNGVMTLEPVSKQKFLKFRPTNEQEIDMEIIDRMVKIGFEKPHSITSILGNKYNQAAGTYYLLAVQKSKDKEAYIKTTEAREGEVSLAESNSEAKKSDSQNHETSEALAQMILQFESKKSGTFVNQRRESKLLPASHYGRLQNKLETVTAEVTIDETVHIQIQSKKQPPRPPTQANPVQAAAGDIVFVPGIWPKSKKGHKTDALDTMSNTEITKALLNQQAGMLVGGLDDGTTAIIPEEGNSTANQAPNPLNQGQLTDLIGGKPKSPKKSTRRTSVVTTAAPQYDTSLYVDVSEEDGHDDLYPGLRTIKFAFNCQTSSALGADKYKEHLEKIFTKSEVRYEYFDYWAECEYGDVKFQAEICKLPRMAMYGIRFKRVSGDLWDFKTLSAKIVQEITEFY